MSPLQGRQASGPSLLAAVAALLVVSTFGARFVCGYVADNGIERILIYADLKDLVSFVLQRLAIDTYYPPLYTWLHLFVATFAGIAWLPHALLDSALVVLGAWFLYRFAQEMGVGKTEAAIGAAALLLLPGVARMSRVFMVEQPLLTLIPATLFFLARSRRLTRSGYSAALGLCLGLGALTKWTFFAYLLAPLAIFAYDAFFLGDPSRRKSAISNLLLAAAIAIAVAGPWYALVFDWKTLFQTASNDPTYAEPGFLKHLMHNLRMLVSLTGAMCLALLGGLLVRHGLKSQTRTRSLLALLCLAVPLALLSLPVHLEDRYIYPILPLAILPLFAGDRKKTEIIAPALVLTLAIFYFATFQFQLFTGKDLHVDRLREQSCAKSQATGRILDIIAEDASLQGLNNIVAAEHPIWKNPSTEGIFLRYEALTEKRDLPIDVKFYAKFNYREFRAALHRGQYDYLVLDCWREGVCDEADPTLVLIPNEDLMPAGYIDQYDGELIEPYTPEQLREDLGILRDQFDPLAKIDTGDGLLAQIYRKKF
jgi:Dolichyl-phosphate-mannose-protein mannosyltransferase